MSSPLESMAPVGDRFFSEILNRCRELGDQAESESLELKGADLDPRTKVGAAKIAKFLIGAANRDPRSAASLYGGYALMAIGVEKDGSAPGIDTCDIADIDAQVQRYLGGEPIQWSTHWLPIPSQKDRAVLFIIVNPPQQGDPIRWCARDGGDNNTNLVDGDIYVRVKGATRRAKGVDLDMLQKRLVAAPRTDWNVDVTVELTVLRDYTECCNTFEAMIQQFVEGRAAEIPPPSDPMRLESTIVHYGGPNAQEYRKSLNAWHHNVNEQGDALIQYITELLLPSLKISIRNSSSQFLKNLEISFPVPLEEGCHLIERDNPDEYLIELMSDALELPSRYSDLHWENLVKGYSSLRTKGQPSLSDPVFEVDPNDMSARLTLPELRPSQTRTIAFRDYVFYTATGDIVPPVMTWSATAEAHNVVKTGETQLSITEAAIDSKLRAALLEVLS